MNRTIAFLAFVAMATVPLPLIADATPDAAAIYKSKCAMCHGADGGGQTPTGKSMKVRDLRSADVQKMSDAELAKIIGEGKGKMPGYKSKLTAEEIQVLVSFIRQLKK